MKKIVYLINFKPHFMKKLLVVFFSVLLFTACNCNNSKNEQATACDSVKMKACCDSMKAKCDSAKMDSCKKVSEAKCSEKK